jgi:ComF family protein
MGYHLMQSERFGTVDALLPLPLHAQRERMRGFNQARILCEGIHEIWNKPILDGAVLRKASTESQTRKNRLERWLNMENQFELKDSNKISGCHVLLIDDVVTTGATLEACGRAILSSSHTHLSIATLCFSSGN